MSTNKLESCKNTSNPPNEVELWANIDFIVSLSFCLDKTCQEDEVLISSSFFKVNLVDKYLNLFGF